MADDKKPEGNSIALPVTVLLAILASMFLPHPSPFQNERPSHRAVQTENIAAQDVDARLWQDPFAAINQNLTDKVSIELSRKDNSFRLDTASSIAQFWANSKKPHPPSQLYNGKKFPDVDEIMVLAVTLSGGPYQEAAEQRLRWRYAVLSALANQDATPDDEQHIGYFQPEPKLNLHQMVAFEWWSWTDRGRTPNLKKKVLLLWVNESDLSENPAAKLKELLRQAKSPHQKITYNYAVIGPNTSTLLEEMLREVDTSKTASQNTCGKPTCPNTAKNPTETIYDKEIIYYSADATASDETLLSGLDGSKANETVPDFLRKFGVTLYRTTATDKEMMEVLTQELALRRVSVADHVVILSEWDTFYGRAMRGTFLKAWPDRNPDTVNFYGYMRGLDGKLPDKEGKSEIEAGKNSETQSKSGANAQIELPEGQSQKDYLRRLADNIGELDRRLKENGNRNGVAAIGVLGSDVHDKLMILEALRPFFSHQQFFTTDLDAVYSYSEKWRYTHNMLAASAYGLTLSPEFQKSIPPFRDSHQTAFFLAAHLALSGETNLAKWKNMIPPRLFEIGRNRPLPLPTVADYILPAPEDKDGKSPSNSTDSKDYKNLQPGIIATSQIGWTWTGGEVALIVLILAGILYSISSEIHNGVVNLIKCCKSRPLIASFVGFALLFLAYRGIPAWNHYMLTRDAEPFYWLEGVSAWPSQLLRLAVCLFAGGFFIWGRGRIRKMYDELQSSDSDSYKSVFSLPRQFNSIKNLDVMLIGSWDPKERLKHAILDEKQIKRVDPDELWIRYLAYRHQKKFGIPGWVRRVFLESLAFLLAALLLMSTSGFPNAPVRGIIAECFHWLILGGAVLFTVMLTMWVMDNAYLCHKLIANLSEIPSKWNEIATNGAIVENKIPRNCVDDWLDIQLVARLTATMQQLIWGPIICLALILIARSPVIDDWDIPWVLGVMSFVLLVNTLFTEILLQRGATSARIKAIDQLKAKIREELNQDQPNEAIIKRIDTEIESIQALREGAFRPWYEWPLVHSVSSLGILRFALEYFA